MSDTKKAAHAPEVNTPQHPDDEAVDRFAAAMKGKLLEARSKGRSGWQDPNWTPEQISSALRKHVEKGDPRDVANYCMFLWARGAGIAPAQEVHPVAWVEIVYWENRCATQVRFNDAIPYPPDGAPLYTFPPDAASAKEKS
jgi:hypothetical protein